MSNLIIKATAAIIVLSVIYCDKKLLTAYDDFGFEDENGFVLVNFSLFL